MLAHGHPIVLAGDGDVGGLIGIHYCEEMKIKNPIVSIDGLELKEFDYIDIGAILDTSGAVPVVIKSLIFPTSAGVGKDWTSDNVEQKICRTVIADLTPPPPPLICTLFNIAFSSGMQDPQFVPARSAAPISATLVSRFCAIASCRV